MCSIDMPERVPRHPANNALTRPCQSIYSLSSSLSTSILSIAVESFDYGAKSTSFLTLRNFPVTICSTKRLIFETSNFVSNWRISPSITLSASRPRYGSLVTCAGRSPSILTWPPVLLGLGLTTLCYASSLSKLYIGSPPPCLSRSSNGSYGAPMPPPGYMDEPSLLIRGSLPWFAMFRLSILLRLWLPPLRTLYESFPKSKLQ